MNFFEVLAHQKGQEDDALRTASMEISRETEAQFGAFASAYGDSGISLITPEVEQIAQRIAARHGIEDKTSVLVKTAIFGLQNNDLLGERKHWTPEEWSAHYQNLTGQQYPHAHPESLEPRGHLNNLNPNQPAPEYADLQNPRGEERKNLFAAKDANEGTPSPKMDKRKWTPKTVGPLKGVDDPKGPNPTKHMDVVVPHFKEDGTPLPQATDKTQLEDIGEHRTERYDLDRDKQK